MSGEIAVTAQPSHEEAPGDEAPGPRLAADATGAGRGAGHRQAEWFLPTGRAGLLPESMTESWDDEPAGDAGRTEAAGAPPWAGEELAPAASSPPPWESGPWPGPGGGGPAGLAAASGGEPG